MSKRQIIKELQTEITSIANDYVDVVDERDAALSRLRAHDDFATVRAAAKKEAAIQEKVDGIRAGLIPVEDLRKAIKGSISEQWNDSDTFTLRFGRNGDRIQKAISDALIAKPKFAEGGYTGIDIDSVKYVDGGYIPRYFNPGMTANSQRVNGSFLGNWAA